jgi:DNA repair protein RadD
MNALAPNAERALTLRPLYIHQERAIELLRRSLAAGHKRPMLQAPTGFGKTLTAAWIIQRLLERGKRVAFVVPRLDLVAQALADFEREGIWDVGVMQGLHERTDGRCSVQICSAQTLARRKKPGVDFVFIDEAHIQHEVVHKWMASPEMASVTVVGLSATPWSKGLGQHYDDLVIAATTRELIDNKFLSDFVAFAPSDPDLSGVRTVAGDFKQDELSGAMGKAEITADIVKTWLARGGNRPTLAFCVDRKHAQSVCDRFLEAGVAAEYADCDTPREARQEMFARFLAGETKILCNCQILTTGIDLPIVSCLIDAAPTKSRALFVQKIGRGLRTAVGKDKLIILDHGGNHLRLGRVTDIAQSHLDDGKKQEGSSKKEKSAPTVKLCPECKAVLGYKARKCLACGAQVLTLTEVIEAEGELVEFGSRRSGKLQIPELDKEEFYRELKWLQAHKGHKSGWCWHKFKERFKGEQPPKWFEILEPREPSILTKNWIKSRAIAFAKIREGA